jgi:hypothetical protein
MGFGELDAIVVNVFDSLGTGAGNREAAAIQTPRRARPRRVHPHQEENYSCDEAEQEGPHSSAARTANLSPTLRTAAPSPPDPAPDVRRQGDKRADLDAISIGRDRGFDTTSMDDPDFLLSEEEEKFVEQTVAWLAARPNPDILLDRIWNRLIDVTEAEEARLEPYDEVEEKGEGSAGETRDEEGMT